MNEQLVNRTADQNDLVPEWAAAPLIHRLRECRFMLYQHGILTDAQSDRAEKLIKKKEAARG